MTDLVEHISRQLARRAVAFAPTSWNTLMPLFERFPEAIFFGNGAPALELIPVECQRQAAMRAWQDTPEVLNSAFPSFELSGPWSKSMRHGSERAKPHGVAAALL